MYRFRLIGAQGLYAYQFSVDGHKLIVVATDSFWVEPVEEADYIIFHTGEIYDFFLNATETGMNYIMRAETLEVSIDRNRPPPYDSLEHIAEAILHYRQEGEIEDPVIPSSDYQNIVDQSPTRVCSATSPCKAVNCPFENFHSSYYINCTNVNDLKLLEATPSNKLPNANPDANSTFFVNFNFEGGSDTSSINGRNFLLPAQCL